MTAETYRLLDAVADAFNPLLALLGLAAPFLGRSRPRGSTFAYFLVAGLSLGVVYLVRALDERHGLWSAVGLDYSTHSAFATAIVVAMAAFRRRWWAPLVLALAAYFALELAMGYHDVLDILSSSALVAIAAGLAHVAVTRSLAALPAPADARDR